MCFYTTLWMIVYRQSDTLTIAGICFSGIRIGAALLAISSLIWFLTKRFSREFHKRRLLTNMEEAEKVRTGLVFLSCVVVEFVILLLAVTFTSLVALGLFIMLAGWLEGLAQTYL